MLPQCGVGGHKWRLFVHAAARIELAAGGADGARRSPPSRRTTRGEEQRRVCRRLARRTRRRRRLKARFLQEYNVAIGGKLMKRIYFELRVTCEPGSVLSAAVEDAAPSVTAPKSFSGPVDRIRPTHARLRSSEAEPPSRRSLQNHVSRSRRTRIVAAPGCRSTRGRWRCSARPCRRGARMRLRRAPRSTPRRAAPASGDVVEHVVGRHRGRAPRSAHRRLARVPRLVSYLLG